MAFALQLRDSLQQRESQAQAEFEKGDALGLILSRYLLAVEAETDSFILTSILLLDGNKLQHGAAPSLPDEYCAAIHGLEIGPCEGSCGTAAYFGHPVYVTDIESDPFWAKYKHLALQHGLKACWSTPIFDEHKNVLGTFAIYHPTTRGPTQDEIDAIETITDHVARAILWSRNRNDFLSPPPTGKTTLKLV